MSLPPTQNPRAGPRVRPSLESMTTALRPGGSEILDRWPPAGLAAGVVQSGSLVWFLDHGVADAGSEHQSPSTRRSQRRCRHLYLRDFYTNSGLSLTVMVRAVGDERLRSGNRRLRGVSGDRVAW
jgi:hypothetical protein